VVEVVPKRQVKNEAELEEALEALRGAAAQALSEADAVELQ
jgi:hypothetical protein